MCSSGCDSCLIYMSCPCPVLDLWLLKLVEHAHATSKLGVRFLTLYPNQTQCDKIPATSNLFVYSPHQMRQLRGVTKSMVHRSHGSVRFRYNRKNDHTLVFKGCRVRSCRIRHMCFVSNKKPIS